MGIRREWWEATDSLKANLYQKRLVGSIHWKCVAMFSGIDPAFEHPMSVGSFRVHSHSVLVASASFGLTGTYDSPHELNRQPLGVGR